jgi:hypothetical protein
MRNMATGVIVFLLFLVTAPDLRAEETGSFEAARLKVEVGYFLPVMSTQLKVDPASPLLDGTRIDLENDLGLTRELSLGRVDGYYRLGRNHRLQFGYFGLKRDAVRVIDKEITVGDTTFRIGARMESEFKNSITEIGYMYSFYRTERMEVSGTFGLHLLEFRSRFTGETTLDTVDTASTDASGPLPLIGIDLDYALNPRWLLSLRSMIFAVKLDTYDGRLADLSAKVEYFFLDNLGVGFGINRFDLDVTYSDKGREGQLSWRYEGMQVYVTARL